MGKKVFVPIWAKIRKLNWKSNNRETNQGKQIERNLLKTFLNQILLLMLDRVVNIYRYPVSNAAVVFGMVVDSVVVVDVVDVDKWRDESRHRRQPTKVGQFHRLKTKKVPEKQKFFLFLTFGNYRETFISATFGWLAANSFN